MYCWGSTKNGELGLGGIEEELILAPRQLNFPLAADVAQVSSGDTHTVAVTTAGRVLTCGSNDHGQLGHDRSCKKFELVDALSSIRVVQAGAGADFTVALDEWGRVYTWGADNRGQLGGGAGGVARAVPKIVKGLATSAAKVVQVSAGSQHCLALTNNGELHSWGCNAYGQLGKGTITEAEPSPCLVASLNGLPIAFIACGAHHSFAVSKSGAVYGWGKNSFGQLGLNDNKDRCFPCHLKTLRTVKVKYVACGEDFSVFLTADGGVFTCGAGMYGQLGHGTQNNEFLPRKVLELMGSTVTQVACGRRHTLAFVPSRGRIFSFGLGGSGQLGTRLACNASTPQEVLGPWVSPSGVLVSNDLPPSSTTLNSVRHVYAGGDRCFAVVTTFLDAVPPDDHRHLDPRSQILALDLDKVKECKRVPAGEVRPGMDLIEYLELVFNSQSCLNGSLLLPNDEHYCCTARNHGVDMAAALICFQAFGNVTNKPILELVLNIVVSTLQSLSPSPPDVEALRLYLVLPLYHEFENPSHWESLQNPFGQALMFLKTEAGQVIVEKWWTLMSKEYMERLVQIYKAVVVHILVDNTRNGPLADGCHRDQYVALEVLARLYKMSKAMDEPLVPYETFYIPEVRDRVNLQEDYYRWWLQKAANRVWFCHYPFLFDAEGKLILLETDQQIQMRTAMNSAATRALTTFLFDPAVGATITAFLELSVGRETIVADTIRELSQLGPSDLKKPLKVKFFGEEAEDAGGVRKEFFMLLMNEILDPKYGMFRSYEETRTVWFSEDSLEEGVMYYLIGILCGLAIYNFTIINLPFPLVLYKKLLNERVSLQDVKGLSPSLAKSFQDILDYEGSDFEQVFDLTFEVSREAYGEVKTVPLRPDGGSTPVTQQNKGEFIQLYVDMLLNVSVEAQFKSFYRGFHQVCGGKVLEMFQAEELMAVVVGNENYDWSEMERLTEYKGGYARTDKVIKWFWEVFRDLSLDDKKKFLMFLTGCDRIPISGMKSVRVTIQPTGDDKCLPVAHTCFNLLDLPRYSTKEKLRYKLLQAIQQNLGFSLV